VRPYAVAFVILALPLIAHCNSIVGVQDVHLSESHGDAGSPTKHGDDDDSTVNPTPTPSDPPPKPPDSGQTGGTGCNSAKACTRIAFVTRGVFSGNLGGIAGADQKCADAAKPVAALAGHVFKAWLSDSSSAATSRLPHGTSPYQGTNKAVIGSGFDDLVDGSVGTAILFDETGKSIIDDLNGTEVWTGTDTDGTSDPLYTCSDWTSDSLDPGAANTGVAGDASKSDASWTDDAGLSCNALNHLYCVEF
jgi:hypothetical protein